MAEGYDNEYIAQTLRIGADEVEQYTKSIYGKLGIDEVNGRDQRTMAVETFVNQVTSVPYFVENEAGS